jgi:hypothetical protein
VLTHAQVLFNIFLGQLFFHDTIFFASFFSLISNVLSIIIVVDHDLDCIFILPWQHHLASLDVFFCLALLRLAQLFHSISIS